MYCFCLDIQTITIIIQIIPYGINKLTEEGSDSRIHRHDEASRSVLQQAMDDGGRTFLLHKARQISDATHTLTEAIPPTLHPRTQLLPRPKRATHVTNRGTGRSRPLSAADDASLSPERDGLDAERGRGVAGEQGRRSE